jgi:hypothetical protein
MEKYVITIGRKVQRDKPFGTVVVHEAAHLTGPVGARRAALPSRARPPSLFCLQGLDALMAQN